MSKRIAWLFACLVLAATVAGAQETAGSAAAQIETDLRLERKLLSLDLAAYREARTVEQRTRDQVTQVAARLDEALAGSSVALGTLEAVHLELSSARAAAEIAADRVEWQLQRLEDRLRRIGFLEGESGRPAPARDLISGTWTVTVQPGNQTATWNLTLNGTLVTGSYRMGRAAGSFRGTYTDNRLRLERVDATRGFDSVYLGSVDPAAGRLIGTWTANDLASGQPARGEWSATRNNASETQP